MTAEDKVIKYAFITLDGVTNFCLVDYDVRERTRVTICMSSLVPLATSLNFRKCTNKCDKCATHANQTIKLIYLKIEQKYISNKSKWRVCVVTCAARCAAC